MKFLFKIIFILSFILSCKVQKKDTTNYEYNIIMTYDNISRFVLPQIVFKNKIFEFIVKQKTFNISALTLETGLTKDSSYYLLDTTAVQIIDISTNSFILIDSFKSSCKILNTGKYDTSKIGLKPFTKRAIAKNLEKLRDTLINGQKIKYSMAVTRNVEGQDSTYSTGFCIEKQGFISIFTPYFDYGKYQFLGYKLELLEDSYIFSILIDNVKPLNKTDELMCSKILALIEKNTKEHLK